MAEAAKKEQERRQALQGKKIVLITNLNLSTVKKKPAVITQPVEATPEFDQEQPARETPAGESLDASSNIDQLGPEGQSSSSVIRPQVLPSTALAGSGSTAGQGEGQSLEDKWQKAKEYADLLELKMNSLWQDFYSLDDMTPRDTIQQEIADTFSKLEKAREVEARAREELDRFQAVKKD